MKQIITLVLLALGLSGCTSSNSVTSADQYEEINALGKEKRAGITLMAEAGKVAFDGDFLSIGRDSVQWVDPGTGLVRSVPTAKLHCIRFTGWGAGALEGAAIGAAPGAVFLALLLAGPTPSSGEGKVMYKGFMEIFVAAFVGGAIVGAGIGALIGHKTDYVFNNNSSSGRTP
jgi:hypothetical protein